MNIGVDIKAFKNGSTGINRYIRCILDELQQADSENHYYLFECKKSDYMPTNSNWTKITARSKLPGTIWMQLALPKLLRKHKIDIFWAPEQICPVFRVPPNVKIVTTIHDFTYLRYPETCELFVLLVGKSLMGLTIKKTSALLPVSDYIANELTVFYPTAKSTSKIICAIYNGVNDWGVNIPPTKRSDFLFFPGNLEPRKNLSRLIKALEIVNEAGIDISLRMCGPKGWKNSDFHQLIKSSPIKNRIKHLGFLSDEELTNQYLTCKAVVFPSSYEGFGLPVIEALRLNTPVLTSRGTVMEEVAGENAMYFDPHNVDSIAETIMTFLKNGGPAINRENLNRYTWKRSAEKLLDVFTEIYKRKT
ncbi:MAG: glycosyltransferase family 4 protein [Chitinispirillales bacterium]|jgi:glycosyltransferase involved in cell wall biosynthesis|nr:glycosyltransferase family 4 protein [Chitinispirillales bacterium]